MMKQRPASVSKSKASRRAGRCAIGTRCEYSANFRRKEAAGRKTAVGRLTQQRWHGLCRRKRASERAIISIGWPAAERKIHQAAPCRKYTKGCRWAGSRLSRGATLPLVVRPPLHHCLLRSEQLHIHSTYDDNLGYLRRRGARVNEQQACIPYTIKRFDQSSEDSPGYPWLCRRAFLRRSPAAECTASMW